MFRFSQDTAMTLRQVLQGGGRARVGAFKVNLYLFHQRQGTSTLGWRVVQCERRIRDIAGMLPLLALICFMSC